MAYYDVALFDADDTLFDFRAASKNALRMAMEKNDLPYTEELHPVYMRVNQSVWDRLERGEINREELKLERFRLFFGEVGASCDLERFNDDYMAALGESAVLLPGAERLCREVSLLCRIAIVTNGFERVQRPRMEKSGLSHWVGAVYISEKIGFQKPRAEFFDAVLGDMGISDRSRVILLGDSLTSDMAGGANAGIDTCWYNPGHKSVNGMKVTYEIDRLEDFVPIVRTGKKG